MVAILAVWCYSLSSFAQQGKRPLLCAVWSGAWCPLVQACQWMSCILLNWHSKNCTCSLVLLPCSSVSHFRSGLELDVKATCFLFSWQPLISWPFVGGFWKLGYFKYSYLSSYWLDFPSWLHLFSEVLWYHLKEELHKLASMCLDLLYETDIWGVQKNWYL